MLNSSKLQFARLTARTASLLTIGVGVVGLGALMPQKAAAQDASSNVLQGARITTFGNGGKATVFRNGKQDDDHPTLVTSPLSAMIPYFGLTKEQATKIEEIQKKAGGNSRALLAEVVQGAMQIAVQATTQNKSDEGGNSSGPTVITLDGEKAKDIAAKVQAMQAQQAKTQQDQERAEKEIELVLLPAQRPSIASFLRDLELFQDAELPVELIKQLDLNGPQKRKLQIIVQNARAVQEEHMQGLIKAAGQSAQAGQAIQLPDFGSAFAEGMKVVHDKSLAVLTPDQRVIVEKWEKENDDSSDSSSKP